MKPFKAVNARKLFPPLQEPSAVATRYDHLFDEQSPPPPGGGSSSVPPPSPQGRSRWNNSESAKFAAANVNVPRRNAQMLEVYRAAGGMALSSCDVARALEINRDSASPRIKWLRRHGFIKEVADDRIGLNVYGKLVPLDKHVFVTDNPSLEQIAAGQAAERERKRRERVKRLQRDWPLFTAAEQVQHMCEQGERLSPVQRAAVLQRLQLQQNKTELEYDRSI